MMDLSGALNLANNLRVQIALASGGVALVLSLLLSFYTVHNSQHQIEAREGEAFETRARHALDVLDRGMFERSREIQNAAILDDIRQPDVPIARKREILERLQASFNAYAWIGICDARGVGKVGTGHYLEGKDLSKRPWCTEGRARYYIGDMHDALLLAKLLPNPSGETFYLVDVAAPVKDRSGKLQGVLCGHIYWSWAEEMLDSKRTPGEDIFLLSQDGLVLSGPEAPRSQLRDLAPLTMQAIQEQKGGGSLLETWRNGKTYLVGYSRSSGYREYPGMGWISLVRKDVSEAYAPARELSQRIMAMGGSLGLLFAWLGWLLAGRIARPITQISEAADRISGGDLQTNIPLHQGEGEVAHLSTAIRNMVEKLTGEITQRRKAEEGLRLSAKVFESNSEAIMISDADQNILMVNPAFTQITGYAQEEVLGRNPRLLSSGRQSKEFYRNFYHVLATEGRWSGEIWNRRKNGDIFPEWATISVLYDSEGAVSHYITLFIDITERKREEERIQYLANYDILTGLPNRHLLSDRLNQAIALAQRHQKRLAILFIDLDHFKNVNDSLGHEIGDALLQQVAERLAGCMRRTDTLARQGGDEFVALLGEIESEGDATFVAGKIITALFEPFEVGGHRLTVSPSIGVSLYPEDGATVMQLLRNADLAMYRAKDAGRNRIEYYTAEMSAQAVARLEMENELRVAISKGLLQLYYQPKVSVSSGKLVGMEALLRWQHPELGQVSPAQFIPVAEESGYIYELGDWVLREAVRQQLNWRERGYRLVPVAVNLSVRQFSQPDFVDNTLQFMQGAELESSYIELELTESVLLSLMQDCLDVMERFRAAGIHLALDDFGTGYSSLSRLKLLPVSTLKIDQSFVRDINFDKSDEAIVKATVTLAHAMGIKVVAEGVETEHQLAYIRDLKCEEYQGYLFSPAVPAATVERYLLREQASR